MSENPYAPPPEGVSGRPAEPYSDPATAWGTPGGYPPPGQAAGYPPAYQPGYQHYPTPGQPPVGQPMPFGGPPPGWVPASRGTNGLSIAALVLGIVWVYWIGSILAVIFGHISLSQIKRTGQGGKGMAIAGLVLGYLGLAMLVLVIIGVAVTGGDGSST